MLKIYSPEEIESMLLEEFLGRGSNASVFAMANGEAYKEYHAEQRILGTNLVSWEELEHGIKNLEHLLELSKINLKSFCSPTGVCLAKNHIYGFTMKRAMGKIYQPTEQSLESLIPHERAIKTDIIELSKNFEMHDVGRTSIFYDPLNGFTLVDLDFYSKASFYSTENNLFMFYFRILSYIPEVQERIYQEFKKGIDYYRLEIALEVIRKYLNDFHVTEEEIRLIRN